MLQHNIKAHVGVAVNLHAFLISTLDGSEWLVSCHGRYTPGERDPGVDFIARWVGILCQSGFIFRKVLYIVLNGKLNMINFLFSTQAVHCTESLYQPPSLGLSRIHLQSSVFHFRPAVLGIELWPFQRVSLICHGFLGLYV